MLMPFEVDLDAGVMMFNKRQPSASSLKDDDVP